MIRSVSEAADVFYQLADRDTSYRSVQTVVSELNFDITQTFHLAEDRITIILHGTQYTWKKTRQPKEKKAAMVCVKSNLKDGKLSQRFGCMAFLVHVDGGDWETLTDSLYHIDD